MNQWRRAALLSSALVLMCGRGVTAECVGSKLDHYIKYADAIFLGVIKNVRVVDASKHKHIVTVDVSRVW